MHGIRCDCRMIEDVKKKVDETGFSSDEEGIRL